MENNYILTYLGRVSIGAFLLSVPYGFLLGMWVIPGWILRSLTTQGIPSWENLAELFTQSMRYYLLLLIYLVPAFMMIYISSPFNVPTLPPLFNRPPNPMLPPIVSWIILPFILILIPASMQVLATKKSVLESLRWHTITKNILNYAYAQSYLKAVSIGIATFLIVVGISYLEDLFPTFPQWLHIILIIFLTLLGLIFAVKQFYAAAQK